MPNPRIRVALIRARQRLSLSQVDAGELLGRDRSRVARYESGVEFPPAEYLLALACAGEVEPLRTLCREAGLLCVPAEFEVPERLQGTSWERSYVELTAQFASALSAYAEAAADRAFSCAEHAALAEQLAELANCAGALQELHRRCCERGCHSRVDDQVSGTPVPAVRIR